MCICIFHVDDGTIVLCSYIFDNYDDIISDKVQCTQRIMFGNNVKCSACVHVSSPAYKLLNAPNQILSQQPLQSHQNSHRHFLLIFKKENTGL